MLIRYASMAFAAALIAAPVAMAQSNNPTGNLGSNRSATASPGTADSTSSTGMHTGDSRGGVSNYGGSSTSMGMTSGTPGSTGHTVVPGNNSTVASDHSATTQQRQTGNQAGSGSGGGK